jgi:hypothetical protein
LEVVARPGEWEKVVGTTWGEAIMCSPCRQILLACPDTDVDPIKPGEQYDEAIYHTFARPEGWQAPRQRTISKPPVKDDWIAVQEKCLAEVNGQLQDLNGAEGRIVNVEGDDVFLALSGNSGMGGSDLGAQIVRIPAAKARVMVMNTLTVGSRVVITRGDHRGCTGIVKDFKHGDCQVEIVREPIKEGFKIADIVVGKTLTIPVERLDRVLDQ